MIAELRAQIERLDLERDRSFDEMLDEFLAREFNGCGPDWLPAALRKKLSRELGRFMAAFLIHDHDFTNSDGTWASFCLANARLLRNCVKIVKAEVHWIRFWKRIQLMAACREIWFACQAAGWKGYVACAKRRGVAA